MNRPCEHLKNLTEAQLCVFSRANRREECLKEGTRWVSLRQCMTCGHVGCCDSSPGNHATKHFHKTQHPVMRSGYARRLVDLVRRARSRWRARAGPGHD